MVFRCPKCKWACTAETCSFCGGCKEPIPQERIPRGRLSRFPRDLLLKVFCALELGDRPSFVTRVYGIPGHICNNYRHNIACYPQERKLAAEHVARVAEIEAAGYRKLEKDPGPPGEWWGGRVDPDYVQKVYDAFKSGAPAPGYVLPPPAPPEDFGVKPILGASVFPAPTGTECAG